MKTSIIQFAMAGMALLGFVADKPDQATAYLAASFVIWALRRDEK